MKLHSSALLLTTVAALSLAACGATPVKKSEQFWQRKDMSEAVYAQGPKAQQMLHRDIAHCVAELKELEGLDVTKNAIPTDFTGRVLDPDELALYDVDSPSRNGHMLMEQKNYGDFESCMGEQGWERIKHVPFEVAAKGRVNYERARVDYDPSKDTTNPNVKKRATSNDVGDFSTLND